jgi:formate hydrogenlyase subunit 6/NADH:ubiquinone oxidoreductase subunit I
MILIEALLNFFRKPFTINYPKQGLKKRNELFRGVHVFRKEKCIGCGLCEKNCPSNCIKADREKKKIVINLGMCTFCGLCRDMCPAKAIEFSKNFEISTKNRKDLIMK